MDIFMAIVIGLAVVIMIAGGIFYNKLRAAYYGIIGVGGSYMALIGIMMLCILIGTIFGGAGFNAAELITGIIFMLIGLGYLVYAMISRCHTTMQRVLLPLVAVMIAFGFCWRFLLMLVIKVPMSDGSPAAKPDFPQTVTDDKGESWDLELSGDERAEYRCRKTGERQTFSVSNGQVHFPGIWRVS